jgi:tetratricopeptide (TPR) repeat protein
MATQSHLCDEDFNEYCNSLDASLSDTLGRWRILNAPQPDMFQGYVENYYQYKVTKHVPSWLTLKDTGNDALKVRDYEKAIACYKYAYRLTSDRYYGLRIMKKGFISNNEDTARRRVIEIDDLVLYISQYLYSLPHEIQLTDKNVNILQPNMPAAICLGNMAVAYMNMGEYETALKYTKLSISKCPIYLKAHKRLLLINEKLKMVENIEQKKIEIEYMSEILPFYACGALAAKWINLETFIYYQMIRFSIILKWLTKYHNSNAVSGVVSFVECYGRNCITIDITILNNGQYHPIKIDGAFIKTIDSNEDYVSDIQHNGTSYELCKQSIPRTLQKFMEECKEAKLKVYYMLLMPGFDIALDIIRKAVHSVDPECKVSV